jgi:hypothetical protein
MVQRKRLVFGAIYALILTIATFGGIEIVASFFAPAWPARALRATPPVNPVTAAALPFSEQPWLATPYNSWGMRDSERTIVKKSAADFRVIFVGDSFVESSFTPQSLPAAVERRLKGTGRDYEALNLGVSATGPRSYYYRLRDVALKLSPDAILLFIYAGNDFLLPDQGFSDRIVPPLFSESPGESLLGALMPRTNWLVVNRLRLAESLGGRDPPPGEEATLYEIVHGPPVERLPRLVAHVRKHYFPALTEAQITEILSRGGNRYWEDLENQEGEHELLLGWTLANLIVWEAGTFGVAANRQEAARLRLGGEIEATLSWIVAADRLAQEAHIPLKTYLIPVASLDPDYAEFWKPWPRAFVWNYVCEDREFELAAALRTASIPFVNLREALEGVRGTYRKRDGHWTKKGEAIAADRIAQDLKSVPGR